tara:strand:+ start:799 stop:942 length:144 start_codon:yes stop_codon:yes gene_type:complete
MVIVANILQKPSLYSLYMTKLQVCEKRSLAARFFLVCWMVKWWVAPD